MTELAREYGDGLYALCAEEHIEQEVLRQLHELKTCFHQEADFLRLLSNMSLPKEERVGIIDSTLRGQVHPYVLNFLKILCERGALGEFAGCETAFRQDYNRDHGVIEATVTTRLALTPQQREALTAKLQAMTGREVQLQEQIDPAVTGGVLLEMNGQRYDGTIRHRLESIRQAMTAENG